MVILLLSEGKSEIKQHSVLGIIHIWLVRLRVLNQNAPEEVIHREARLTSGNEELVLFLCSEIYGTFPQEKRDAHTHNSVCPILGGSQTSSACQDERTRGKVSWLPSSLSQACLSTDWPLTAKADLVSLPLHLSKPPQDPKYLVVFFFPLASMLYSHRVCQNSRIFVHQCELSRMWC